MYYLDINLFKKNNNLKFNLKKINDLENVSKSGHLSKQLNIMVD